MGAGSKVVKAAIEVLASMRRGALPADDEAASVVPKLRRDNPGAKDPEFYGPGGWLGSKIREAAEKRASATPYTTNATLGGMEGVTGFFRENLKIRPEALRDIKGAMGEERFAGGAKLKNLEDSIAKEGYRDDSPVLIAVREDGTPFIVEGNNRVEEAIKTGRPHINVDIQYLRGAEDVEGPLSPDNLPSVMALPTDEAARMAVNKSEKDASDIFGAGATRVIYKDQATGGYIEVVKRPDGPSSVIDLQVPEQHRRRGVGAALQKAALDDNPKLMGQVSSKSAARSAFNQGRRPYDNPNATIDDVLRSIDENSSVNMTNLNLPTDEASRMARAQEMGFDETPLFHGTSNDITEFVVKKNSTGEFGPAVYLTTSPGEAAGYAGTHRGGQNVMPVMARLKNPMKVGSPDEFWQKFGAGTDDAGAVAAAKKAGHDGVIIERPVRQWDETSKSIIDTGETSQHYIVFDPKNIRSTFAQFDPAKAGSADILAGLGVVGAGAALSQQDGFDYGALRNVAEESNGQSFD